MELASGVESNLAYRSYFYNGSWFINRYSPAPTAIDTCACSVAFNCSSARGKFFCVEGNNCTVGTTVWEVPGLVQGCTGMDHMYLSDLRCFYNRTCVDTILSLYNVDMPDRLPLPAATLAIEPLNISSPSRFSPTDTLSIILDELMVEEWEIQMDFVRYYAVCMPSSCTYVSVQRLHIISVVTTLIGLTGGLSVVLRLLVAIFGRLLHFGIFYWRSRRTSVAGNRSVQESSTYVVSSWLLHRNFYRGDCFG